MTILYQRLEAASGVPGRCLSRMLNEQLREIGTRPITYEEIVLNSGPTVNITRTAQNRHARILWEAAVGEGEFTQEVESVFLPLKLLYV